VQLDFIPLVSSPAIRRAADRCFAKPPMVFPIDVTGRTYAVRSASKPDLFYRVDLKLAPDGGAVTTVTSNRSASSSSFLMTCDVSCHR